MYYVNGNVGIGTTGPTSLLTVNGEVTANQFNALSDYRIKTNIQHLDTNVYSVNNFNPVSYTNILTDRQDFGLIAHELQKEIPFLVSGEKDGPTNQSINYNGLIALLIKEIQNLKSSVNKHSVPVGCMLPFAGLECPEGYLWTNGSVLDKEKYQKLFEVLKNETLPNVGQHIIKY